MSQGSQQRAFINFDSNGDVLPAESGQSDLQSFNWLLQRPRLYGKTTERPYSSMLLIDPVPTPPPASMFKKPVSTSSNHFPNLFANPFLSNQQHPPGLDARPLIADDPRMRNLELSLSESLLAKLQQMAPKNEILGNSDLPQVSSRQVFSGASTLPTRKGIQSAPSADTRLPNLTKSTSPARPIKKHPILPPRASTSMSYTAPLPHHRRAFDLREIFSNEPTDKSKSKRSRSAAVASSLPATKFGSFRCAPGEITIIPKSQIPEVDSSSESDSDSVYSRPSSSSSSEREAGKKFGGPTLRSSKSKYQLPTTIVFESPTDQTFSNRNGQSSLSGSGSRSRSGTRKTGLGKLKVGNSGGGIAEYGLCSADELLAKKDPRLAGPDWEERENLYKQLLTWFSMKSVDPPSMAETQNTGLIEYFSACDREIVAPCSAFILNARSQTVDLSKMQLFDQDVVALCDGLCTNRYVDTLLLSENSITQKCSTALTTLFTINETLTTISLSNNPRLGSAFDSLSHAVGGALREICASGCGLNDQRMILLSHALSTPSCRLTKLDLSWNKIGDKGLLAIASALPSNTSLTDLNLSRNRFLSTTTAVFFRSLSQNLTLEILDISHNPLGREGATELGLAIMPLDSGGHHHQHHEDPPLVNQNQSEEGGVGDHLRPKSRSRSTPMRRAKSKIKHLNVAWCGVDAIACSVICEAITKSHVLRSIDMRGNPIADDGARAFFKALSINRSVQKFDLRGCNMGNNGVTIFEPDNPAGRYSLDLADPSDQHIAGSLQKLSRADVGQNWRNVKHNGKDVDDETNFRKWDIPKTGFLELHYRPSGRLSKKQKESSSESVRPLDPEDAESMFEQLSDPALTDFERLTLIRSAATAQYYSCEQTKKLLSTFSETKRIRSNRVDAFVGMFARILDRKNIKIVRDTFGRLELQEIAKCLGPLLSFNPNNPTNSYVIDLDIEYERSLAEMLYEMSRYEDGGTLTFLGMEDVVGKKQFGIIRAQLNGNPFRFDPRGELPDHGILSLDYISGRPVGTQCANSTDSLIEYIKSLFSGQDHSDDWPEDKPKKSESEEKEEPPLDEMAISSLVEESTDQLAVQGQHAGDLLKLFSNTAAKIRTAMKLFSRLRNREKETHFLFESLSFEEQMEVASKMGNLNMFDEACPFRHYRLDLSDRHDYALASRIFALASGMPGENIRNEQIDGEPFQFSENNFRFALPPSGILEFDFVDGSERVNYYGNMRGSLPK